jgi:serine protease AprX
MVISVATVALAGLVGTAGAAAEISPALADYLSGVAAEEYVPITISVDGGLDSAVYENMTAGLAKDAARELVRTVGKDRAAESQAEVLSYLGAAETRGEVRDVKSLWAANAVAAEVTAETVGRLAGLESVRRINLDVPYPVACGLAWGVAKVGADQVWNGYGVTGEDVLVAVTDTGVDYEHTDLENRDWVNEGEIPGNGVDDDDNGYVDDYHGWNTVDDNNNTRGPTAGHGSHCAGTVCGDGTAGTQTGVAPGAFVMPVQVLSNSGSGSESTVWEGMEYAFDNGADVTSMSLGWCQHWYPDRATWRNLCETLIAGGMVYSIAAGNERTYSNLPPPLNIRTPGDVPAVITVGATYQDDTYVYFSSYGPTTWEEVPPWSDYPYPPGLTKPDVVAPGYEIISVCGISGGYTSKNGTSMATPHVAGFAALILEVDSGLTNAEVRKLMEDYALDLGDEGKDNDYGSGRIQCYDTIDAMFATPIKLTSFTARAAGEDVRVRWETGGTEELLAGFNLYRRTAAESAGSFSVSSGTTETYEKLNDKLVRGHSPYLFADDGVEAGKRYEYLLEVVTLPGRTTTHGPVLVRAGGDVRPVSFWLAQSAPNPARERTVIKFGVAEGYAGRTVIDVYDLSGRRVATALDADLKPGAYEVELSTAGLAPGVYVYRMAAGPFSSAKRIVVAQ